MTIPNWFTGIIEDDAKKRRRYIKRVENLTGFRQLLVLLSSDVSVSVGSLGCCHLHRKELPLFRFLALSFVRLEWLIQDNPSRPCIGWRMWAYGTPRAVHLDVVLRLGAIGRSNRPKTMRQYSNTIAEIFRGVMPWTYDAFLNTLMLDRYDIGTRQESEVVHVPVAAP